MQIKLRPVTHEFNNCFHGQVETIVEEFYHKNYLLTQLYRWTTILDIVDGKPEVVTEKDYLNTDELKMQGLEQIVVKCRDRTETVRKIKDELKHGIPVIAGIQISNCPWDPNYKKEFVMEHMIIINGFDEKENNFICCDSTYEVQDGLLPVAEFQAGCTGEYRKIIEFDKNKNLTEKNLENLLKSRAEELAGGQDKHFQRLEKIADYLKENADNLIIHEKHLDNVLFSENYMMIRDCAKVREMLAYIIKEQLGEKGHRLTGLFELCMKKWLKIRILYVRAATLKDPKQELLNIAERLYEIKNLEKGIVNYIINDDERVAEYLEKGHSDLNASVGGSDTVVHVIDLSSHYNNKAFGRFDNNERAEFTSLGEYMLRPSSGFQIPLYDGQLYELTIPDGDDNVVCRNQNISVHLRNVSEILVIGTTEYSTEQEQMILRFEAGEEETVLLDFPEWYTEILNDETLIMKQDVIARENGEVMVTSFAGKIFLKRFRINNRGISNLILPGEGRIHIFQIVMLSKKH